MDDGEDGKRKEKGSGRPRLGREGYDKLDVVKSNVLQPGEGLASVS